MRNTMKLIMVGMVGYLIGVYEMRYRLLTSFCNLINTNMIVESK